MAADEAGQPLTDATLEQRLDALLVSLAHDTPLKGAQLCVELPDASLHLDVVRGEFEDKGPRQLQAIAHACVVELLGERAADHAIQWQLQRDERHLLLCAVPSALLETVCAVALRHGMHLVHAQPGFAAQWNYHFRRGTPRTAVFAVACEANAVVTFIRNGAIVAISNGPWLERPELVRPTAGASSLMSRQGMGDCIDQPALDLHTDRLLSSHAFDAEGKFLLVGPRASARRLSKRWAVAPPVGVRA
jgi:hypothetical protein